MAGRRDGLAGERSGLFFEAVRILYQFAPTWFLFENVPGLLSSCGGRDFASVLEAFTGCAFEVPRDGWCNWGLATGPLWGIAWRVLDAQWFGVPQRRRRVFVVGCLGDFRRAAEILFERNSLPWDSAPSREARQRVAAGLTRGSASGSGVNPPGRRREDDTNLVAFGGNNTSSEIEVATACRAHGSFHGDFESETFIVHSLRGEGFDASEDGTGRGTPIVTEVFQCHGTSVGPMGTLKKGNGSTTGGVPFVVQPKVRRLTPRECERLQGTRTTGPATQMMAANYPTRPDTA